MNTLVTLSKEWNTNEFLQMTMADSNGPSDRTKTDCSNVRLFETHRHPVSKNNNLRKHTCHRITSTDGLSNTNPLTRFTYLITYDDAVSHEMK